MDPSPYWQAHTNYALFQKFLPGNDSDTSVTGWFVANRVRDFAEVKGKGVVDSSIAESALEMLEVDRAAFDRSDRALLKLIAVRFSGGPVGLSTIAVATRSMVSLRLCRLFMNQRASCK